MKESWLDVLGYERLYEVSDAGQVRNVRTRHVLRPEPIKGGYLRVSLSLNGTVHRFLIHHLVLYMFVGLPPVGHEAAYYDRNPQNNRLTNLRWATRPANYDDRRRHGTDNSGERNGRAKVSAETVQEARRRCAAGETQASVARELGVPLPTLNHWMTQRTWKHGAQPKEEKP